MKKVSKYFRTYRPFMLGSFKSEFLAYRLNLMIWMFYEVLSFAVIFFLWQSVFASSTETTVNGLTFPLVVYYYLASKLVFYLSDIDFGHNISNDVKKGTIAMQLIKPISYRTQLLFIGLGRTLGYLIFFAILPIIGIFVINHVYEMNIQFDIVRIGVFVLSCFGAIYIAFCLKMMTGAIRLFTINGFGVFNLERAIFNLFSGTLVPIMMLPQTFQVIYQWLPFQYTVYSPSSILIGSENDYAKVLGIQGVWIVVLYLLSTFIWNRSIRKAVILGG